MNDVLTDEQVADLLGCEAKTVIEKAAAGELPAVKFGRGGWRFPREALLTKLNELALANTPKRPRPEGVLIPPPPKSRRRAVPTLVSVGPG